MTLLEIVILLLIVGLVVEFCLDVFPIPAVFKKGILLICGIWILAKALQFFGISVPYLNKL